MRIYALDGVFGKRIGWHWEQDGWLAFYRYWMKQRIYIAAGFIMI